MGQKPDLSRLMELHKLLLEFQAVERVVYNPQSGRRENDVEHSYHLAMTGWFLAPHFGLDAGKVIRIALAHDLVEVHAGDTFAFGSQEELATKDEREHQALLKLEQEWADFPEMLESLKQYKTRSTPEARFVYTLDKVMPMVLNYLGEGLAWRKHGVTLDHIRAFKKGKISKTSEVYPYYQELIALLRKKPHFFHQDQPITAPQAGDAKSVIL